MPGSGTIDALKVGLGIDISQVEGKARQAKRALDTTIPAEKTIKVSLQLPTQALREFKRELTTTLNKGGEATRIQVPITPKIDKVAFEKAIHTQLGTEGVTIPVYGKFMGWRDGQGPPQGFGGGGGGGGPAGPPGSPFSGRGGSSGAAAGPASAPAQGRAPRPARARASAAPTSTVTRRAPNYMGGGVEVSSSDRYEAQQPVQRDTFPPYGSPVVAPAARPVTQRGAESTRTDKTSRPYVTTTNVKQGGPVQELEGDERAAYASQQRGRPTPAAGYAEQPGERQTVTVNGRRVSRITPGASASAHRRQEELAQAARLQANRERLATPEFQAAREAIRTGFQSLDPNLAGAFDLLADPDLGGDFGAFLDAAELSRNAYAEKIRPKYDVKKSTGRIRRTRESKRTQRGRSALMGFKPGFEDVDPNLLLLDASIRSLREFGLVSQDPNYVNRTADNALRGPGGKVGRQGGRNAGRVASETVELSARKPEKRFKPLEIREPGEGEVFGFGTSDEDIAANVRGALGAQGGQGLFRSEFSTSRQTTDLATIRPDLVGGTAGAPSEATKVRLGTRDTRGRSGLYGPRVADRYLANLERRGLPINSSSILDLLRAHGYAEGGYLKGMRNFGPFVGLDLAEDIAAKDLKAALNFHGPLPRPGSRARVDLEAQFRAGVRNRRKYEQKPLYQRGGKSDPQYAAARSQFLSGVGPGDLTCAHCGKHLIPGDKGPSGLVVDHIVDTASGGDPHDPSNFQLLCNSCNGYKGGGRSSRSLQMRGYAEGGSLKAGGLLMRMAQAGHEPSIRMVGERGPELEVSDPNTGQTEVVPTHKVATWLQRAKEGRGFAKDLTGHAEGGSYFRFGNKFVSPAARLGGQVSGGDIVRVFVTNWPQALTAAAGIGSTKGNPAQGQANQPGINVGPAPAGQQRQQGNAGAAGAPTPGATRPGRPTSFQRVVSREAAQRSVEDLSERISLTRGRIQEAQQLTPVRALSVAFGQIAQATVGGRTQIQAREREAGRLTAIAQRSQTQLEASLTRRADLTQQLRTARAAGAPQDQIDALVKARLDERQASQRLRARTEERVERAEGASQNILTRGQQIRSQGAGLVGILGGTALFSGAVAAFSAAGQAMTQAIEPQIDALSQWSGAIQRTTQTISQAITASNGSTRQAAAQAFAPTGLSAAFVNGQIGPLVNRAQANAASANLTQQVDIQRAISGLGGNRFDAGLFGGTGGLFGSNIATNLFGGQQGVLQGVSQRLAATTHLNANPLGGIGALFGQQSFVTTDEERAAVKDFNDQLNRAAGTAGKTGKAFQLVTDATSDQIDAMKKSAQAIFEQTHDVEVLNRARELANLNVAAVGPNGQALTGQQFGEFAQQLAQGATTPDASLLLAATQNQRKAQAQLARIQGQNARNQDIPAQAFLQEIANPLSRFGTTFSTAGRGFAAGGVESQKTLANIEKYSKISSDAQTSYLKIVQQGRTAAEDIVSQIDQPHLGSLGLGTVAPPTPQVRRLADDRERAVSGAAGTAPAGPSPTPTIATSGSALSQFRSITSEIEQTGKQIQDITDNLNLREVNAEVHQYDEQIRLTTRALGDASDLWSAIQGNVKNTVGGLQGQNLLLDRQNQLLNRRQQQLSFKSEDIGFRSADLQQQLQQLQFGLQQRQINFSVAQAGFTAPGTTPEERAARIAEAKVEAEYAQKQLNLQKQIAKQGREQLVIAKQQAQINREIIANQNRQQDNAFTISVKEAQRNVGDLKKQLDLAFEGRAITIDQAAAQKTIEDLQKKLAPLQARAEEMLNEGQAARDNILKDLADLSAQTGKDMTNLVGAVENAWSEAAKSYINNFLTPVNNQINTIRQRAYVVNPPAGNATPKTFAAGGYSGEVSAPTEFVAGEAGREHVFVIRNPKSGMMAGWGGGSGGGGGVNFYGGIHITIQGGGASDDKTANELARKVEDRINRKLAMLVG